MADNTLSFETKVDLGGLNAGLNSANSSVSTFANNTRSSMTAASEATNRLADAQRQLGAAAQQGNAQAAAIIAQFEQEVVQATSAVNNMAAAETQETAVLRNSISARQAGSVELKIFEGNMQGSTRAASAFLSTLPGVGAALQAAFSVFGAIAFAEVIVDIGEKLYTAFDIGGQRARKTAEEITSVQLALEHSTTSLDVQIDKLAQEEAKLEHKPFNGMKLVLDEAAESADRLEEKLKATADTFQKTIAGMSGSLPQLLSGSSQTGYEQTMLQEHAKWIGQAKNNQDQYNEAVSYGNSLQVRLAELKKMQADSDSAASEGNGTINYQNEINAVNAMIGQQQREQAEIKATIALNVQQAATQNARDHHTAKGPDPQIERLRLLEEALNKAKLAGDVSAEAEGQYWDKALPKFRDGSAQYETILSKMVAAKNKAAQEFGRSVLQIVRDNQETIDSEQRVSDALQATYDSITKKQQEAERAHAELTDEEAKGVLIQQQTADALEASNIQYQRAIGGLTPLAAAQAMAALHTREHAQAMAELQKEYAAADARTDYKSDDDRNKTMQPIINKQASAQGKSALINQTDTQAQANAIAAPYLTAFNSINNGFLQVTNKMIMGTQSISRDFAQMGAQLVVSTADAFEKMLAKSLLFEIQTTLAHQASNTAKIASDASAAVTTAAISTQSAFMQVEHEAAVAAAKAWSALSGIPIVGPVLGAAAAGATYAGVMALAAFEQGGIIAGSGPVPILGHGGERVLTAGQTRTFDEFVGNMTNNSSSSNSNSLNQTNHYHGMSDKHFQRMMTRNSEHMVSTVQRGLRRKGMA